MRKFRDLSELEHNADLDVEHDDGEEEVKERRNSHSKATAQQNTAKKQRGLAPIQCGTDSSEDDGDDDKDIDEDHDDEEEVEEEDPPPLKAAPQQKTPKKRGRPRKK